MNLGRLLHHAPTKHMYLIEKQLNLLARFIKPLNSTTAKNIQTNHNLKITFVKTDLKIEILPYAQSSQLSSVLPAQKKNAQDETRTIVAQERYFDQRRCVRNHSNVRQVIKVRIMFMYFFRTI